MAASQDSPTALDPRSLSHAPERRDLGQILLRDGSITLKQLDESLRHQAELASKAEGGEVPRLGEILVQKGYATAEAVARALSEQDKTILFCPTCEVLLNIDRRPDAVGYLCGKCQGKLVPPPPGSEKSSAESSVIVNSALPVPPEVQAIKDDPSRRFGKYVILDTLGRGGIAVVYRAWDIYLHQYVALKRIQSLPPEETDERQSRVASLLNEAHNAIRLRHPNIVSVYDVGRVDREYYISMEYLDGKTMFDAIAEALDRKRVSPYHEDPGKWLDVLFQVAHAVHYAHTRPIPTLHCDLKPGNIIVTREGRVCVLDFGLARQLGEYHSELGVIVGTPSYMSPEQACGRSDEIDARSDVYGLGSVLYELLCGRPPFVGSMGEVLRRTVNERVCPPTQVLRLKEGSGDAPRGLPPIPPALEALCLRCLEKKRELRPTTALSFAQDLESIVRGGGQAAVMEALPAKPVSDVRAAVPPPSPPPALLFPPRNRLIAAAALAVALLGGWILWPSGSGSGEEARESEALKALAQFRPELVVGPASEEANRRTASILGFKKRLMDALVARRPVLAELSAGERRLRDVKVWRGRDESLVFSAGGEPDAASWTEIGPAGIGALARACGMCERPEDRFGLALYCLTAGGLQQAKELFEGLKGTPLEAAAARYLASLGERG